MGAASDLTDDLPDAVLAVEGERVVFANPAAGRLLAADPATLVGASLRELTKPGEADRLWRLVALREGGWAVPETTRVRFLRRDGTEALADTRLSPTGTRLILCARDATESHAAEVLMARLGGLSAEAAQLLDLDSLLDASSPIFEALGWLVTFTEVDGARGVACVRRVVGAMQSPVAEYGRSLIGKEAALARYPLVSEVLHRRQAIFLSDVPSAQVGPAHAAVDLDASMQQARGQTHTAWLPVPDEGKVHVLAIAAPSLTERDRVALQLFAGQVAAALRLGRLRTELVRRERLAALGEMAAVLAHEVRNPLGVMFNAVDGLRRTSAGVDGAAWLDILNEEATRLQRLVSELLDFARPSPPTLVPVSLAERVHEALDAARKDPSCCEVRARVETSLPETLPRAWADPLLLRRALVNVLLNALQHVPPGGLVRVSLEHPAGDLLRLRVFNDGPAIPAEQAARMFEPFFTTRAAGTGLGLAVARQSMESQRGRLELEPRTDGVSFALWIPQEPSGV